MVVRGQVSAMTDIYAQAAVRVPVPVPQMNYFARFEFAETARVNVYFAFDLSVRLDSDTILQMSKRVSRSTVSSSTEGTDVFDELYAKLRTEDSLPQQSPLLHLQQHFMYIVESIQLDSINSLTIVNL